jgi:membrane protease YdiL (CAAX protease family)
VLDVPLLVVVSESPSPPRVPVAPADAAVAAATALALVYWNNLLAAHGWHNRHYVSANLTGTAALLALARLRGIRAHELGLAPQCAAAGARLGGVVSGMVVVGFAAAAFSPNHRRWLSDARVAGMSKRHVAYHAALRVPLGTAVWEETAFRAVLPALLQRVMPVRGARVANSVLFGVWHVRPTLEALRLNGVATGGLRDWAGVAGAVVANVLADILLSRLQRTTGSLLAPTLVHVATNSGGTVAAAVAQSSPRPHQPANGGRPRERGYSVEVATR